MTLTVIITRSQLCALSVLYAMALLLNPGLPAQPASSSSFFLPGSEQGSGGACASTTFKLTGSFGSGVVAEYATSPGFKLLGGFNGAIEAPTTGRPWLTGVVPLHGPLLGGTVHTLAGTELDLGVGTNVTVGGRAATVVSRARDRVVIKLPAQTAPGWQTVTATNSGGTAILPRAVGVLPIADRPRAIEIGQPFRITYRGSQGDIFYVAVAGGKLPFAFAIPPYHHGLELNLAAFIALIGPLPVTDPSGELHLDFPGIPFVRPIYIQMLGLPTANPGYAPGSFTNVLAL